MRKSHFKEEQIVAILRESEAGLGTAELCRKHGICENTFYRWKSKYGGMSVSEAQRLKQLEDENRKLKQMVADLMLDKQALQAVLSKSGRPAGSGRSGGSSARSSPDQRAARLRAAVGGAGNLSLSGGGWKSG